MSTAPQATSVASGLRIQTRVTGALIMREIVTRYGRHNIGFMWVFAEPMMFTLGVVIVWSLLRTHTTRLPVIPFVVTGYSSLLRSEEHTSELQSPYDLVCRLLLEKKKQKTYNI